MAARLLLVYSPLVGRDTWDLVAELADAGCPRLPLAMFTEVHPPVPRWPDAPAAYLLLSGAYADVAARARELGWPVLEQLSHHLALLTDPRPVAGALRELIGRLG